MKTNANRVIPHVLSLSYLYESDYGLCAEEHFHQLVDLETKRAARSKTISLLLSLDVTAFEGQSKGDRVLRSVTSVLFSSTREIDAKGWYRYPAVLGILVTDVIATGDSLVSTRDIIVDRLRTHLEKALGSLDVERIGFSCQTLPSLLEATRAAELTVQHLSS
jgi:hypothetical protein